MNDELVQVKDYLAALAKAEERWLVAVSGGGDSVSLLHLVHEAKLHDKVIVGCFNHHWGPFGNESAYFVTALAGKLGFKVDLGNGAGKADTNAEAVARMERHAWFEAVCKEKQLAGVLIAHTQDDLVETFLMRAGKGSGLTGLAGMSAITERDGLVWQRPLLSIRRETLREYLREVGQKWLEDPDNEAGGSQRAKVRKLLPQLEAAGVTVQGMAASVAALADADAVMAAVVDELALKLVDGVITLEREIIVEMLVESAVRIIGRMIRLIAGDDDMMLVRRSKRLSLWQRIRLESRGVATLGGVKFAWDAGTLTARKE